MPPTLRPLLPGSHHHEEQQKQQQQSNLSVNDYSRFYGQVTDYLKKKGFTKTEAVFRQETAYLGPDGRPAQRSEDPGPKRYLKAFVLLRNWIENNLDIYKVSAFGHTRRLRRY